MELVGIVVALASIAIGVGTWLAMRSARHKERARAALASLQHAGRGNAIDEAVARMSDADLDRELRDTERK